MILSMAEGTSSHLVIIMAITTTTAVVGTTGAGKTTIGRLLFRFFDPLGGRVLVDGVSDLSGG